MTKEGVKIFRAKSFPFGERKFFRIRKRGKAEKLSRIIKFNSHFNSTPNVKLNRQIPNFWMTTSLNFQVFATLMIARVPKTFLFAFRSINGSLICENSEIPVKTAELDSLDWRCRLTFEFYTLAELYVNKRFDETFGSVEAMVVKKGFPVFIFVEWNPCSEKLLSLLMKAVKRHFH